jgi:hypothetical protein
VANTLLRLLKEVLLYLTLHWATLLIKIHLYFVLTNGTAGSADYTTTNVNQNSAGATTELFLPTTADTIAESNETFTIASGTASATEQSMIMMCSYCSHDHCFGYRRKSCCVWIHLSNPSDQANTYTLLTNGTAGSADYTTNVDVTYLRVQLRNVSVPTTADTIDEETENFSIASGTLHYGNNYRQ